MHALVIGSVLMTLVWIHLPSYPTIASNPTQFAQRSTGFAALFSLLLTLTITPLKQLTGWVSVIRFRRTLGLLSFFFATLHFGTFLVLDHGLDATEISVDIAKRPLVLLGVVAFFLLIPLAATSSTKSKMWLGGARWKRLHQLVYPASALAIGHYYALKKVDLTNPLLCALALSVLFAWRIFRRYKTKAHAAS